MKSILVVGSINTDLVVRSHRQPKPGETLAASSFEIFSGGKGANQAGAAARLGSRTFMIGHIGSDSFGAANVQTLEQAGVDTRYIQKVDGSSGVALIVVAESGENSIMIVSGANSTLTADDIFKHRDVITECGMVLTQLETPLPVLDALASTCEDLGVPLMLDPAPARVIDPRTMRRITWLTPNESEAGQLFGISVVALTERDLRILADRVLIDGPQNLLLKLGSRGAYLATAGGLRVFVPAISVSVIDTTAAGDAFNGAFAHSLCLGASPLESAKFAVAASALSVTRRGALPSMPSLQEVRKLLASETISLTI